MDHGGQPEVIQFCGGVVDEHRRTDLVGRLHQLKLRQDQGKCEQLLLAAGQDFPGGPVTYPESEIGSVWTDAGGST